MERAILVTGFLLLCLTDVNAMMFPRACIKGNDVFPVICCPEYNGTACGAHLKRGNCRGLPSSRSVPPADIQIDDRYQFPKFYFNLTCQCNGNFDGPSCGECKFGWTGEFCDISYIIIRKEIRQLTVSERHAYFAALHYCKSVIDPVYYILRTGDRFRRSSFQFIESSYYDVWSYAHYYATKPFINNTQELNVLNYAHGSTGFLSWHQLALLLLEKQIQRCLHDPYFALAYYQWADDPDCTICNNEFLGESDTQGNIHPFSVFSTWRMVCGGYDYAETSCLMPDCECQRPKFIRRPGVSPFITKPSRADVDYCMSLPDVDTSPYDPSSMWSARNCFEGFRDHEERGATSMHNLFHVFMDGTMAEVPISCNDPMFLHHHAFIDKLFNNYKMKFNITPASYPPNPHYGHGATTCIAPFLKCWQNREMFMKLETFGVNYTKYEGY